MSNSHRKGFLRLIYSLSILLFAAAVFLSHTTGRLYPWIGIGILATSILLLLPVVFNQLNKRISVHLVFVALFAFVYREYVFLFPASMVGLDPDGYALWVQGIIKTGSIDVITGGFYSDAPLFDILPAVFGLVADTAAPTAMAIYPLLISLLFPLTSYLLVRRVTHKRSVQVAVAAAIVASVGTMSVTLSYQPIAQTLGVALWCVFLITFFNYISARDSRLLLPGFLLFMSLLLTHKLPPTLIVVVFFSLLLSMMSRDMYIKWKSFEKIQQASDPLFSKTSIAIISTILLLGLYIQYFNFGGLALRMVIRVSLLFEPGSDAALYQSAGSYRSAVPINGQIYNIILRRGNLFILMPLSGVAWLLVLYWRRQTEQLLLLAITAVAALFMIGSLFEPTIGGVGRSLFLAEPALAVLVAVGFLSVLPTLANRIFRTNQLKTAGFILLIVIIFAQATSATVALPDQPTDARTYLTKSEIAGKIFSDRYTIGCVSADAYYASENPIIFIQNYKSDHIVSYDPQFLFGSNISLLKNDYILLRSKIKIYRSTNGIYRILWNPDKQLSQRFNRVYANGEAILIKRN